MEDLAPKLLESLLTQGPLVGYLFWQVWKSDKKIADLEEAKDTLNKELNAKTELYLSKAYEMATSSNEAVKGLRDAIVVKNGG